MHELAGITLGGDDIVPAAADEAVIGQTENGGGERVAVVVIVE
jgi:hypothetical protein